jgi:hypothetical protein
LFVTLSAFRPGEAESRFVLEAGTPNAGHGRGGLASQADRPSQCVLARAVQRSRLHNANRMRCALTVGLTTDLTQALGIEGSKELSGR